MDKLKRKKEIEVILYKIVSDVKHILDNNTFVTTDTLLSVSKSIVKNSNCIEEYLVEYDIEKTSPSD